MAFAPGTVAGAVFPSRSRNGPFALVPLEDEGVVGIVTGRFTLGEPFVGTLTVIPSLPPVPFEPLPLEPLVPVVPVELPGVVEVVPECVFLEVRFFVTGVAVVLEPDPVVDGVVALPAGDEVFVDGVVVVQLVDVAPAGPPACMRNAPAARPASARRLKPDLLIIRSPFACPVAR